MISVNDTVVNYNGHQSDGKRCQENNFLVISDLLFHSFCLIDYEVNLKRIIDTKKFILLKLLTGYEQLY